MYSLKELENDIELILISLIDSGFETEASLHDYFWNCFEDNIYCIPKEHHESFKQYYFQKNPIDVKNILNKKIPELINQIEYYSESEYSDSETE